MAKLDWNRATAEVAAFLKAELRADGKNDISVAIHRWDKDNPAREAVLGPRVAEVDFFRQTATGGSGNSFMQVDLPHGASVCLCAEHLIIAYAEGDWAEDLYDEEWRLCMAVFKRGPKTKVAPLAD